VSVKPTALGLKLGSDVGRENLETVVRHAREHANFVRIDMEDSTTTDDTLRMYRELREVGLDNVGVVLQARLRRTLDDIAALADLRPNVRICKGIYLEPESIAFTDFEEIRASYVRSLEALLETASFVGIATHDEFLISEGKRIARERYEFQMLLGVRESLGQELVRGGERLRIYVPFGRQWYEYSLRRLQENPRIAGYVATDTFGRLLSWNGGKS
jgi:proline dehydrogenase